jgi:adenylate cyclase class 2
MADQEIEAKFFVRSLAVLERRLLQMEARLIQKRKLEVNQRFDLPDGSLRAGGRVLRLRRDSRAVLTYKGSSRAEGGVLSRTELEITVSDMETARSILEALGYVQIAVYEKYRRVYELGACHIMLDELPMGDFVEIEGPDGSTVRNVAQRLGLEIEHAAKGSYLGIFEHYCAGRDLDPALLTFDALKGIDAAPGELGVRPADE